MRPRKALGVTFPTLTFFLTPRLFQLRGDIEHGKSAQRDVIYTVVYGTPLNTSFNICYALAPDTETEDSRRTCRTLPSGRLWLPGTVQ